MSTDDSSTTWTGRRIALFAGVGAFALWLGFGRSRVSKPSRDAVRQLFALTFDDISGQPQELRQWRGTPLIINFWATWCPPCVDEMPDLQRLYDAYASKGVQFLGLAVDNQGAVASFAKNHRITYPLLITGAAGSDLASAFGNRSKAIPFTVALTSRGEVHATHLGRIHHNQLDDWLQVLSRAT